METNIFIFASVGIFVLAWLVFDIYIIVKKGKRSSISAHIIRGSKKYPLMVFLIGFLPGILFGHLFWSMRTQDYLSKEDFQKECLEFLQTIE